MTKLKLSRKAQCSVSCTRPGIDSPLLSSVVLGEGLTLQGAQASIWTAAQLRRSAHMVDVAKGLPVHRRAPVSVQKDPLQAHLVRAAREPRLEQLSSTKPNSETLLNVK